MNIFMISGKARSGKDTFGDALESVLVARNYKVCRVGVGTYIKFYAQKYFGWDGREETKPRELLQMLGTEVIRKKIDPKFHVNRLIEDIKVLSNFFTLYSTFLALLKSISTELLIFFVSPFFITSPT